MFYAQIVGDRRLDNIRQELASMKFNDVSDTSDIYIRRLNAYQMP